MIPALARRFPRRFSTAPVASVESFSIPLSDSAKPPSSVNSIPTKSSQLNASSNDFGAAILDVGCTRRVFLLKPFLTGAELEGLAFRIRVLTKNDALNSVLIATDDNPESMAFPSSALEFDNIREEIDSFHGDDEVWHVSGGYDPIELFQKQLHKDEDTVQSLLVGLQKLALATRGNQEETKIPVITLPHGLVTDGGYALCMGSYVLATQETSFRVLNPSRGLTLDPIGLSFMLPRVGWEFEQASAEYSMTCAMILALTGMEASASDMMETGLATHYIDNTSTLGMLERSLSELPPWSQQGILKRPIRFCGQQPSREDVNANFRNIAVANILHAFTAYNAPGGDMFTNKEQHFTIGEDPSLELDPVPWHMNRESDLVNYAATFHNLIQNERTLEGVMERFREVAARQTEDPEEQEGIDVAADFLGRMEKQSPLALSVTHRLLTLGARNVETIELCMAREVRAQAKLLAMGDFERWAKHAVGSTRKEPFLGWKYKTVKDVPQDEVDEIVGK